MRIGFDARLAGPHHAGIGRYIANLLTALLEQKREEDTYQIWVNTFDDRTWLPRHLMQRATWYTTNIRHYSLAEQVVMPLHFSRSSLDVLHVPHFNAPLLTSTPLVITIHDLLWHEERDPAATTLSPLTHKLKHGIYEKVTNYVIRNAREIIVPSKHTATTVKHHTGRTERITIIPEAVGTAFANAKLQTNNPKKLISWVGSHYPHKNFEFFAEVLKGLPDWHGAVFSAREAFLDRSKRIADHFGVYDRIAWHVGMTDEQMIGTLQNSVALLHPSRSEGYGLTPYEALAVGTPVITANLPVFSGEIANFITRVNLNNPEEAIKTLKNWWQNPVTTSWKRGASNWARQATWEKAAATTHAVYERAVQQA